MTYDEFLSELKSYADENYKNFHKKLLKNDNIDVLGIRTPTLRKLAKKYKDDLETLLTFPDEYYDVTFIKLTAVSMLPYDAFIKYVDGCVALLDNWATCDCFTPKCIGGNKERFLPYILRYAESDKEFTQRFALTTLLHYYVEESRIDTVLDVIAKTDTELYYVHMAAAWLVAEITVKFYDRATKIYSDNIESGFSLFDRKTHNKAIQKSCESFRLSDRQKEYIKGLKR